MLSKWIRLMKIENVRNPTNSKNNNGNGQNELLVDFTKTPNFFRCIHWSHTFLKI